MTTNYALSQGKNSDIWKSFSKVLSAEQRDHKIIRGYSGLDHAVESIAVDDKNKRLIIVSAESNARLSAMMQSDVQAAMPETRILVIRPIICDIAEIARSFVGTFGSANLDLKNFTETVNSLVGTDDLENYRPLLGNVFFQTLIAIKNSQLPPLGQILSLIQQAAAVDWVDMLKNGSVKDDRVIISLKDLIPIDSMHSDRVHGICPVPLYDLTEANWELLYSGTQADEIEDLIKSLGIYQYFYPAADHVTLGFAERANLSKDQITEIINGSSQIGHPLGQNEITRTSTNISRIVEELQDMGLAVEGELGLEITEEGSKIRSLVKFRPREGLISKFLQRFNIKVSISSKDFLPPH